MASSIFLYRPRGPDNFVVSIIFVLVVRIPTLERFRLLSG